VTEKQRNNVIYKAVLEAEPKQNFDLSKNVLT